MRYCFVRRRSPYRGGELSIAHTQHRRCTRKRLLRLKPQHPHNVELPPYSQASRHSDTSFRRRRAQRPRTRRRHDTGFPQPKCTVALRGESCASVALWISVRYPAKRRNSQSHQNEWCWLAATARAFQFPIAANGPQQIPRGTLGTCNAMGREGLERDANTRYRVSGSDAATSTNIPQSPQTYSLSLRPRPLSRFPLLFPSRPSASAGIA